MADGDVVTYNEDGQWKSKIEGSSRAAHVGGNKADQQEIGRQMARERGVAHVVKKLDGTIGEKNSYGKDSNPPGDSWVENRRLSHEGSQLAPN